MALEMQVLASDSHKNMAGFKPINGILTVPLIIGSPQVFHQWLILPCLCDFYGTSTFSVLYCIDEGVVTVAQAMCTRYNIMWSSERCVLDTTLCDKVSDVYSIQHYVIKWAMCTRYNIMWSSERCVLDTTLCDQVCQLIQLRRCVLDTTLCDQVCQWLAIVLWFSPGTSVSSINKTDHNDKTQILLKVASNTINQTCIKDIISYIQSWYKMWIINMIYLSFYEIFSILTWLLLSLCEQTSDLSIGYNLISTCAGACDWL
jgi:hypothetical protein